MNTNVAIAQARTATAATAKAEAGLTKQQHAQRSKSEGPDYAALLREALTEPGRISDAYQRFHNYSLGNALWVWSQCLTRGVELGPIATFNQWKTNGRTVRKGEHALMMYMPVTVHTRDKKVGGAGAEGKAEDGTADTVKRFFIARRNWFVLAQTEAMEGAEPVDPVADQAPGFDAKRAAETLGLKVEAFESISGNVQGYSHPNARALAINPVAADPVKTMIHEMAHCLLHADDAEISDGAELDRGLREVEAEGAAYLVCCAVGHTQSADCMRGYMQSWLQRSAHDFGSANARRIFTAADRIIKAGTQAA